MFPAEGHHPNRPEIFQIRSIASFDEIVTDESRRPINDKLKHIAIETGIPDMYAVVEQLLHSDRYMKLTEVKDPQNITVAYKPELSLEVDLKNIHSVYQFLISGALMSWSLVNNEHLKVLWSQRYEPKSVFGELWENGYYVFSRNKDEHVYLEFMSIYLDKFSTVQTWHRLQLDKISSFLQKTPGKKYIDGSSDRAIMPP